MRHILMLVAAVAVGMVFANTLRGLPILSMLPKY